MKRKKWVVGKYNKKVAEGLKAELGLSALAAKLVSARGITDVEAAKEYLKRDLSELYDPMLMADMGRAAGRLSSAVKKGERITVFGDYDTDGVTATYILLDFLRGLGASCDYYIPDRENEGYGINIGALKSIRDSGASLVVTVDTGITAVDEVEYASSIGLDVIICDHHECPEALPAARAVVNPRRADCKYPFKNLAGVGVAFKLICAMLGADSAPSAYDKYIPFVCLGTVADIMPVTDENRIIISEGLKLIPGTRNIGLSALLKSSVTGEKELTTGTIGFAIAPRINAAGRMGLASDAVELFLCKDTANAARLAERLCAYNEERRAIESDIYKHAVKQIDENGLDSYSVILAAGAGWHHGVIGIVASRICSHYQKPAILISLDGDTGKGSGRSLAGINLYSYLTEVSDLLIKFGGHELAAGLSIKRDDIESFRWRINMLAAEQVEKYVPSISVDFEADSAELALTEIEGLRALEPFGIGNPQPTLALSECKVNRITPIGNNKHLKLDLIKNDKPFQCIYFGKSRSDIEFNEGERVDIVFNPTVNSFRGMLSVQLQIKDARPSSCEYIEIDNQLSIFKA